MSGMPSSGISRPMTTGNLMADCERWCRDNLRRREVPAAGGRRSAWSPLQWLPRRPHAAAASGPAPVGQASQSRAPAAEPDGGLRLNPDLSKVESRFKRHSVRRRR